MESSPKHVFEAKQENRIREQLSPLGIQDERLLNAMQYLPRAPFLNPDYQGVAQSDVHLPIGQGEYNLNPRIVALALQALRLDPQVDFLEIGSGTGYISALASRLCRQVFGIEHHPELAEKSQRLLPYFTIHNTQIVVGDAFQYPFSHRFDAILLSGSVPWIPEFCLSLLKPKGRLFVFVGKSTYQKALLVEQTPDGYRREYALFETHVPPLKLPQQASLFEL